MTTTCEIIGLRIRCPKSKKIVALARADFAIGPMSSPERKYVIRCTCGGLHVAPTQKVTKPTKTRRAMPIGGKGGR